MVTSDCERVLERNATGEPPSLSTNVAARRVLRRALCLLVGPLRRAFYYCHRLTTLALPRSLQAIRVGAFAGCRSFTSVVFAPDHTRMLALLICGLKRSRAVEAAAPGSAKSCLFAIALQYESPATRRIAAFDSCVHLPPVIGGSAFQGCPRWVHV